MSVNTNVQIKPNSRPDQDEYQMKNPRVSSIFSENRPTKNTAIKSFASLLIFLASYPSSLHTEKRAAYKENCERAR